MNNSTSLLKTEEWIYASRQQHQEEVSPDDSMSAVVALEDECTVTGHLRRPSRSSRSSGSSRSSRSSRSSISSIRQKEQAEHAALLARAASLKQKEALELEECQLKARKDQLEVETAIAASSAKIKVLENCEYENQQHATDHSEWTIYYLKKSQQWSMNTLKGHR